MRVYLDMCCYNRPYDDQDQLKVSLETQAKIHIQTEITDGKLQLASSYTLDYECGRNPFQSRREAIQKYIRENAEVYVGPERGAEVGSLAEEIMKTGIKQQDAYHVASGIIAGCDYFISTDKRLLHYQTEKIRMVNPIEFISETEE